MTTPDARAGSRALRLAGSVVKHRLFRAGLIVAICFAGGRHYVGVVDKIYPVDAWLFWNLAVLWAWTGVFSVACLSVGSFVLEKLLRLELPPLEALVQSMAVGVVAFVLCMYAGGALHLYGKVFAVLLPAALIALGARSLFRLVKRHWSDLREAQPANPFVWLISALGACCVGLAYLGALTPDALNYDSTWSHLVIAQDYARHGGIIKFWGNYNMGVPHLASIVHTWGFTVPGLDRPALRWMMALHQEVGLFCWTLAGVAAGVRRMVADPKLRGSWAAFFLFPIIFVYDNNIGGAADHVAAFFAVPLFLATLELWETFQPKAAALLAVSAAGALLTKYQAFYLFVPLALLLCVRWTMLAYRVRRGRLRPHDPKLGWTELVRAPLVLVGLGALLVAPHFVKNAIFYHNPVYPFAQDVFTSTTPSSPNAGPLIRYYFTDDTWRPKGTTFERLKHAFELFATFSFEPHYSFTKSWPAFGSLFTLLLPTLLLLRESLRIWIGALLASGALLVWGFTYNIDRNLQIYLPLMVCVTAALIVRVWRLGWLARVGLAPLVLLQLVWGGDALFYSASERITSAMSLIRSGYDGNASRRFDGYRSTFLAAGKALPKNARLMMHTAHLSLGIDREVVMDWDGFQGFISYDELSTPRELYDYLRKRRITHVLIEPNVRSAPTKQEEVLFYDLMSRDAELLGYFGWFKIYRFPKKAPPARAPYRVVTIGLGGYADGLYPIKNLNTHEYLPPHTLKYKSPDVPLPADPEAIATMLEEVDAVILSTHRPLAGRAASVLQDRFAEVVRYGAYFSVHVVGKDRKSQ
jgi:hypothetical protein